MKKIKVITTENIQTENPVFKTLTVILFLDYMNAPQWIYGVFITLLTLLWLKWIIRFALREEIDLLNKSEKDKS